MRILVVEDFAPLRESLVEGLSEAGFAVDAAADGEEGLWYARQGTYDAVVLDIMLPKLDGLSLLRRVRQLGSDTHVLLLTAKDTIDDRVAGLDDGADDYLVKPFAFPELLARLRAGLRRRYLKKDPIIRVGDLAIDTARQEVHRDRSPDAPDVPIDLTAREFGLLELLALRLGEPVSRTEIWDKLYDFASETTSNVVDVYIGYLRRKLDPPGTPVADSVIQTVRGRGYRLREPEGHS